MKRSEILILVVVLAVGAVILVAVLAIIRTSGPANIILLDTEAVWTEGNSATVSGRLINSGQSKSNPVILEISVTDANNSPLGTVNTAPYPSIIEPGMEATFSKDISDVLGGYSGSFTYWVTVLNQ